MSSVDERIVEMRFENDQFESGVKTSLNTLDKLKAGLNLNGAEDGLKTLQTTAKGFDISNISDGVDKITQRFSLLGIMADQAIRMATTGLINLGSKAADAIESLTIDQIPAGFNKYERKINSVQTIMNATGKDIDTVTQSLDKLNWYTDETSYSYSDMVDNIGKFTSSGVKLDEAVTSMIGIANAAGYAGANVQDASHAMEGFSKAMGQGYMNRQNWQWIRTAHMDTINFKEQMIQAAVEAKTLARVVDKQGNEAYYVANKNGKAMQKYAVSVEDFETNLAKGWLTKDVMNSALAQYGSFTEQIYEDYLKTGDLTSDIIARMGEGTDELGLRAFRASQEAKTFSDAINSVKDAVSTGWMVSFEQIFGNYEEAKKLWTTVANELWDVFASGGEARNEMLKEWHDSGGYQKTLKAISNIWDATKSMGKAIKETFSEFFPPMTAERLNKMTDSLYKFSAKFKKAFDIRGLDELPSILKSDKQALDDWMEKNFQATKNLKTLKNAFSGLFSIVKLGKTVFQSLGQILSPLKRLFSETGKSLFELSGNLGEYVTNLVDSIITSEKYQRVVDRLTGYVDKFTSFILDSVKGVKDFIKAFAKSEVVQNFINQIKDSAKTIKNRLMPYLIKAKERVDEFFESLTGLKAEDIDNIISNISEWIGKFAGKVMDAYGKVKDFFTPAIGVLKSAYAKIEPYIKNVTNTIKDFWNNMIVGKQLGPTIISLLGKMQGKFKTLCDSAKSFIDSFNFKDLWKNIKDFFKPITDKIDTWINDLKEKIENIDLGKLAAIGLVAAIIPTIISIGVAFGEAAKLLKASKGLVTNLNDILNKFKAGFKSRLVETAKAVAIFAGSIAILAGSFKLISTVDADRVQDSLNVLKWFGGGLAGITAALGLMSKFNLLGDIKGIGLAMLELSASLAILSGSLILLDKVNPENIGKNLLVLITLSTMLMTVAGLLGKFVPQMSKGSLAMLSFAGGILILVEAVKRMSDIDNSKIDSSLGVIMVIAGIMATLAAIGGKVKFGSGFGLLGIVGSVFLLLKLFEKLSDSSIQSITEKAKNNIGFIAITLGALAALAAIGWLGGDHAAKTGFAVLAMSASIMIIYEAIKKLGSMDTGVLVKGTLAISAIMLFFTSFAKSTMYANKDSGKAGLAIMGLAASLLIVYLAVKKFGQMDPATMIKGLMGVIPILLTLGLTIRSLRNLKGVKGSFGALLGIAVAVGTIAAALSYLTLFSFGDLAKSVGSLSITMLAFAASLRIASGVKFDKSSAAGFIAGIIAIAGITAAMKILAGENWASLAAAAGGISACLLALAAAMKIASTAKFEKDGAVGSLLAMGIGIAAMAVIAAILAPLADKPWESMLAAAGSISLVLVALTAAGTVMATTAVTLSAIPWGPFLGGLAKMSVAIVAVAAVLFGISYLVGHFDLGGEITEGAKALGDAIGGFLGGIVGEGAESAASHLEEIGNHLTAFMENAGGFFDAVKNIPPGTGDNLLSLAKALNKFLAGDLWDTILGTLSGGDVGFDSLGDQLSTLATALTTFSTETGNINMDNVNNAVEAGTALNTLLQGLAPTGGLIQSVFGEQSWSVLSEGLEQFGTAMENLSTKMPAVDIKNIEKAVSAGEKLNGLLTQLEPSGGLFQSLFGDISWNNISSGLSYFGQSMSFLSQHAANIVPGNIDVAVDAGKKLNVLLTELPENAGKWGEFWGGGVEWATISTGLTDFGLALSSFSNVISFGSFDDNFVTKMGIALSIGDMFSSFNSTFGGDISVDGVNGAITSFGITLKKFDQNITDIKAENITNATEFVGGIRVLASEFSSAGTELGEALSSGLESALEPSSASSIGTNYVGGLTSGISDVTSISTAGEAIANALVTGISSLVDGMEAIGSSYVTGFTGGIDSLGVLSGSLAGLNLAGKVISGAKSSQPGMVAAGIFVGAGFVAGIKAMAGAAYDAGKSLGDAATKGAKDATAVASPSKIFMQIGEYCGEGLAIGFNNSTALARESAVELAKESLEASAEVLKGFDNLDNYSIETQPVITPVLDLSQVSLQAKQMNSILSGYTSISLSGKINNDRNTQDINELIRVGSAILTEIQGGHDLYFDDGAFAGRINRRLGIKV